MKTNVLLKLFSILFLISIFSLCGCSFMGTQKPQWQSGTFIPDGKYYVYTYGETFVTQYQRRGNSTFTQGILTTYLQVIDCATGKMLLEKPYKSKEMINIKSIEGNTVGLWSYKIGDSEYSPAIFDLSSMKMKFSAEDLKKLNPNIPMKSVHSYFKNTSSQPGIIFEADDGTKNIINPTNGKISPISGDFERVDDYSSYCYQTKNSITGYSTTTGTRQKITKGTRKSEISTTEDFLQPKFLTIDKSSDYDDRNLTLYDDNFFILSSALTTNLKDRKLSMLDKNNLTTKWTIDLPQNEQEMNNYNKERFSLQGDKMYVANSTNILVIDLKQGLLVGNYPLFKEK